MAPNVTLADIAKQLGVSKTTVSLALRNKPGVSEETRRLVLDTAQRMGYQEKASRAASKSDTRSIFFLYFGSDDGRQDIDGIGLGYLDGVQSAAENLNLQVTIDYLVHGGEIGLSFEMLKTKRTKAIGALLVGLKNEEDPSLAEVRQLNVPLVIVNRYWPTSDLSFVSVDYEQAEASAVKHLAGLGHRKVAFVSLNKDVEYSWYQQRRDGYLIGLENERCVSDSRFVIHATSATQAIDLLVNQATDATAICASNDTVAIALINELRARGIQVPRDMSVVGFDNDGRLPAAEPPLTTVDYDEFDIGYWAVRALIEQSSKSSLSRLHVVVKTNLVERESCAPPRKGSLLNSQ